MDKADWLETVHRFLTQEWARGKGGALSYNEYAYLRAVDQLTRHHIAKGMDTRHGHHGPSLSQLAEMLGVRRPSASTMLAKLVGEGLLERLDCPRDARTQHLLLTNEGQAAVKAGVKLYEKAGTMLLAALGDHQAAILAGSARRAIKAR